MRNQKRRWRHYETASGRRPTLEFIRGLSDLDKAAVLAAMADVRDRGVSAARHLEGEVYATGRSGCGQPKLTFDTQNDIRFKV